MKKGGSHVSTCTCRSCGALEPVCRDQVHELDVSMCSRCDKRAWGISLQVSKLSLTTVTLVLQGGVTSFIYSCVRTCSVHTA